MESTDTNGGKRLQRAAGEAALAECVRRAERRVEGMTVDERKGVVREFLRTLGFVLPSEKGKRIQRRYV